MQKFYAIKNKNNKIRRKSSSGGVFYEIAKYVIDNNGIVYGAVYDEKLNVKHVRFDKAKQISKFCGSKYVKSDFSKSLPEISKDLENNKLVLFSGTPCQIAAVKHNNKSHVDNLILVDIVCHGAIQKNYFDDYKKMMEKKFKSQIRSINMRFKDSKKFNKNISRKKHIQYTAISDHTMKIVFKNEKTYTCHSDYDPYYVMFDLMIDKGCFKCPFSNLNRLSDITIGDFHEFNSKLGDFNDNNGVSLLIVNTKKGNDIFNRIMENFACIEKTKNDSLQPALKKPLEKPKRYEEFCDDYEQNGFEYCVKKYVTKNYRLQARKIADKIGLLKLYLLIKNKLFKSKGI